MARTHYLQSSFVSGVLDPRLSARTDIKQYYQGMSVGQNVLIVPLGGVKRRPGLRFVLELPRLLVRVTPVTATAPEGGTAANANDDDETSVVTTTNNIGTTDPYVVVHYDIGSQQNVQFADAVGLSIDSGESDEFRIQYSLDDMNWFEMLRGDGAAPANFPIVDATPRTYRSGASSPSAVVPARYLRVVRVGSTDLGTAKATLKEFSIWLPSPSTDNISSVRLIPFERSTDERYIIALTDRTAVIASDGEVVDVVRMPYAFDELAEVDAAQFPADTLILVHKDHPPYQLFREDEANWQLDPLEFQDIPQYDYNDADSPTPADDVHVVTFTNFIEGNTFQLELNGARTGPITYQGTGSADNISATEENIRRAVQKLYTVGFTGVSVAYASPDWEITFGGESADDYPVITGTPLAADDTATISAEKTATGSPRREDIWSETRGYPRCCSFHEGRLWFGGTRSLPQAYFASVVNDFVNFETGEGLADDAVFGLINTVQLNEIVALKSGRFLQLFTSGGEFRFTASPITPADVPRNQTEYGTAPIKPVSTDGATVFVQRTRKVLRDFLYRYEEDAYSSYPLSSLASHLFNSVKDMAAWQGSGSVDANYVFIVNTDGTIVVYCTLRSQEIAAFSEWTTQGFFRAVGVVGEDRYFACRRTIDGELHLFLEIADEDFYLDCAAQQSSDFSGTTVGQNNEWVHLAGQGVRVRADGLVLDNNVPDSLGQMDIDYTPTTLVEAGLNWTPLVTTMPLNSDFGAGDNFMRKKRVVKARLDVYQSLGVLFNGRPLPSDPYFTTPDDEAATAFTGVHSLEESSNWDEGTLTQSISQEDPLPFHLLGLDLQLESS